ncbi:MAG: hypothetical protein WD472_11335 [Dehalococcoidia bacterium]
MTPISRSSAMMICKTCGEHLPLSDFYAGRRSCKGCVRIAVRHRALTNPAVQEYDRARAKRLDRVTRATEVTKAWRRAHPEAYRAQNAVNNAIRDGKLQKGPCSICGTTKHVHGHHKDYLRPLDVTWLCARCHRRLHATFPELGGHFQGASA